MINLDEIRQKENELFEIKNHLAYNSNDQDVLKYLSEDVSILIRYNVAQHPNSTSEILYKLAEDEDEVVRNKAINHKNYSPDLLEKLIDLNDFESDFER